MTEDDVDRIEASLGVKLPAAYRHLLTHFPIKFDQGTSDGPVWDAADALIKRNLELRSARRSLGNAYDPIPSHYIFIGDDGGGWQNLLDVRTDPPIVSVMEFEDVKTISPHQDDDGKALTLNKWFHEHLIELKYDGVDINAATPPKNTGIWDFLGCLGICFVIAFFCAMMVVGFQILTGR